MEDGLEDVLEVQVHNAVPSFLCLPQFLANVRKRKKLPDPYLLVGNNLTKSAATALMALSGSKSTNDDNFCLKELAGTQVRVYYGCGQIIRIPPAVPPPPRDLCIVNKEYRVYKKADGSLKISNDRQNCHYHMNPRYVQLKHNDFNTIDAKGTRGS
ncbi:hypothetical protein OS493_007179 [Desmophyllum pertusum]|uniref:Uncharacterized protein n=1 Tax=Desmophyllum pertusum TaxID=174260 RepID=A0A9W9ZFQ4_9CNID|nr:hypothetical protein OS493_007179 [Desmophyllum pertusum]